MRPDTRDRLAGEIDLRAVPVGPGRPGHEARASPCTTYTPLRRLPVQRSVVAILVRHIAARSRRLAARWCVDREPPSASREHVDDERAAAALDATQAVGGNHAAARIKSEIEVAEVPNAERIVRPLARAGPRNRSHPSPDAANQRRAPATARLPDDDTAQRADIDASAVEDLGLGGAWPRASEASAAAINAPAVLRAMRTLEPTRSSVDLRLDSPQGPSAACTVPRCSA